MIHSTLQYFKYTDTICMQKQNKLFSCATLKRLPECTRTVCNIETGIQIIISMIRTKGVYVE